VSLEQLSASAQDWIRENPLDSHEHGKPPFEKAFFSTTSLYKRKPEQTFMPVGLSPIFQKFFTAAIFNSGLEPLDPLQQKYLSRFVSEDITLDELAKDEDTSKETVNYNIRTGLQRLWGEFSPEERLKYPLKKIWKLKRELDPERKENEQRQNLKPAKAPVRRYKPQVIAPEPQAIPEPEEIIRFENGIYDMTLDEREKDPRVGALFNWYFTIAGIPEDLKKFYEKRKHLQVEDWKSIFGRIYKKYPYLSFAQGQLCYIDEQGQRIFLNPDLINHYYGGNELNDSGADRDNISHFGRLRFRKIQEDILRTAKKAGYMPPVTQAA